MKKIFGLFAVLAALLLGLNACQKEIVPVEKPVVSHTISFVADAPQTKTTATIDTDNKTVDYRWTEADKDRFSVYEINDGVYTSATSVTGVLMDGKMSLMAVFGGDPVPGASYIALFNTGVKSSQIATGEEYDQLSDVLISKTVTSIGDEPISLQFKRETAFALMTAKGLTDGANIIGASLTSDQNIAAEYDIKEEAFKEEGATKTISISNNGGAVSAISNGDGNVFFVSAPITDAHITVGVVTGDAECKFVAAYEKKIADNRSISFEKGNVRPFNIGMNKVTEQALNLAIDETTIATENELSWDRTFVSVVAAKAESQTPTNNYYPGTSGQNYTNTRFYKNSTLTFTPKIGLSIKEIVYEATTEGYTTALVNSTWTNATASAGGQTVTIVPTDGTKEVSAVIGATTGTKSIIIKYGIPVQPTPHSVTIDQNIENGQVTADPSSNVMPGTEVKLTATPNDNYTFDSWNVTAGDEEITVTDNKFSMPNADVVISATFKEKQGDETETSFIFDTDAGLTALGITKPGNSAGTSLGTKAYVSGAIEMTATDGGTETRVWNSGGATTLRVYKNGGSLTFSGATISKIVFTGSAASQTASTGTYSDGTWTGSASSVKFTATGSVTINTITVTYAGGSVVTNYTVSCNDVAGGTLLANPSRAAEGEEVTLTATPTDEEWSFNNDWSVVDASDTPVDVENGKFTMPASNVTVSGSFTQKTYTIQRGTAEHGTFTIKGTSDDNQKAHKGDQISLAAEAESGYEHTGWTVTKEQGGNVTVTSDKFYMPADNVTVTPVFKEAASIPEYTSLSDLYAASLESGTTVKATLTNEVITEVVTKGLCFDAGGNKVEIYGNAAFPTEWGDVKVGGYISGTVTCTWSYYEKGSIWELMPTGWNAFTYKAPCATPEITLDGAKATINCATTDATILYEIADSKPENFTNTYSSTVTLEDGQTIWAKATLAGYPDSEVTSKKYTAGGGTEPLVLTFKLSSKPDSWPTTNSTTLTNYTYTLDDTDYTFALKNVKCNSGYLMLTSTAVLGLPAIAGKTLTKVVAKNSGGCSTTTKVGISSSSSSASYISGGAIQTWSTVSSTYTYTLSGTSANTVYYLYVTNKNAQIVELTLTYN